MRKLSKEMRAKNVITSGKKVFEEMFVDIYIQDSFNPSPAEFLKWNNPPFNFLELSDIIFVISRQELNVGQQKYRDVQAGLALYW